VIIELSLKAFPQSSPTEELCSASVPLAHTGFCESRKKYLYLSTFGEGVNNKIIIYQLDMQYYADSAIFFDTKIKIAEGVPGIGLQLATDGKIYLTGDGYDPYDYISVIHKPWEKGSACNYEADAIFLDFDGQDRQVGEFLPNILVDHLFRFEWEGRCSSQPFVFNPNFQPEPE